MADERPDERSNRGNREGQGSGPREGSGDGQGRRGGRHRGFRGRHGGRPGGPEAAGQQGRPQGGQREPAAQGGDPAQGRPQRESGREDQGQRPRSPRPEDARDMPLCPICSKPVYDLSTALSASREAGDPAHFDCVLERVVASETLAAGEKLVYLGSGSFGVVEFKDKSESAFTVKRRIQWEKEGEKKDWRKGISSRITNL
jgi:hypothetical protein